MILIIALIIIAAATFGYFLWIMWTDQHGAPFVAIDPAIIERMLQLAKVKEGDIVYDLGSGDGRIPIFAALKYNVRSVGIELDFFRVFYSKFLVFIYRLRSRVQFLQRNLFDVNITEASVVTTYLLEKTNKSLENKLSTELKPGTRVVSAGFRFPGWRPLFVDWDYATPYGPLYLYQIGVSNIKK